MAWDPVVRIKIHLRINRVIKVIGLVSLVTVALMMATVVLWQLRAHDYVNIATRDVSAITKIQNFFTTIPGYVVIGIICGIVILVVILSCVCCCCIRAYRKRKAISKDDLESGSYKMSEISQLEEMPAKVSKGKHRGKKQKQEEGEEESAVIEYEAQPVFEPPEEPEDQDEYSRGVRYFLRKHPEYTAPGALKPLDLGSRMQKYWYKVESTEDRSQEKLLTIAPVSQNCPLMLHKRQKGLNKLIEAVKVHPYLHPIEQVDYLVDHQLLVMVQPLIHSGSLKDMVYKTTPLTDWSNKYARRSRGLATDKIAQYGRQILEGLKFLYSKDFPQLGHVQTGNMFIVDDVCHLGGYENTLLGYRTRLFRLCKDHLQHFDVILFAHVMFEMAAGYELTRLRPGEADYKAVDKKLRPVLEYIFEEGFPHSINEISLHEFFGASLPELSDFDPNKIHISDTAREVLEDVRKAKPRVQKAPKPLKPSTPGAESKGISHFFSSIKMSKLRVSKTSKGKAKEKEPLLEDGEKSSVV